MAQAVVLQTEILAKDVSVVDALWIDGLKNQDRCQMSYIGKIHELIDASKRKEHPSSGDQSDFPLRQVSSSEHVSQNKDITQG